MGNIKNCPHCGGKAVERGRKQKVIVCTRCGATSGSKPFSSQAEESWNARTGDNIIHCSECKNYHDDIGWCDVHSTFVNDNGDPVLVPDAPKWKRFSADDYCSKAVPNISEEDKNE